MEVEAAGAVVAVVYLGCGVNFVGVFMANPVVPEIKAFLLAHEDEVARGVFELGSTFKHLLGREPNAVAVPVEKTVA